MKSPYRFGLNHARWRACEGVRTGTHIQRGASRSSLPSLPGRSSRSWSAWYTVGQSTGEEICQLVGVNPRDYLREAVHRVKANLDAAYPPYAMLDDA
jgi:hypothetical protein